MARMTRWARDRHIPIDSSIYLEGAMVKAIMELKFNPGEGVAHLSSADKGLTIMACRGRTSAETERIRKREKPSQQLSKPATSTSYSVYPKGSPGHLRIIFGS